MANSNKPFGLRPVNTLGVGCNNGTIRTYYVPATDSTAIFCGDAVKLAGAEGSLGDSDAVFATVTKAASGEATIGAMVSVEPLYSDLTVNYRKASTAMLVRVAIDPQQEYEIQGDSDTFTAGDVGLNMNYTVSTGSTTTGISNAVADQSSAAATSTLDLQVIGISPVIGNEYTGAYPILRVKLNNHQYSNAATGL